MKRNDDPFDGTSNLLVFLIVLLLLILLAVWVEGRPAILGPEEPAQVTRLAGSGDKAKTVERVALLRASAEGV